MEPGGDSLLSVPDGQGDAMQPVRPTLSLRRRLPLTGVLAAEALSTVGNSIAMVALPWFVLTLTESPLWTGVAAAAGMAPLIVGSLFGGGLIDRFGPRWIAVIGDLISALAVAAVPLLHHMNVLSLGPLVALIALGAAMDGPAWIASESRHPELARLAGFRLERVKAIDDLIQNAGALAGPALAGAMIALAGVEDTLWLTAGCSLAAAALHALSLPTRRRSGRAKPVAIGVAGAMEAARFVLCDPLLRSLVVLGAASGVAFGALETVVMPAFFRSSGQSAASMALFLSAAAGGAIAGTLAYGAWGQRLNRRRLLLGGCAVETLSILALGLTPATPVLAAVGAIAGFAAGPVGPLVATATLRRLPAQLRGRALGVVDAIEMSAIPAAIVAAGAAVETFGATQIVFASAVALGAVTVLAARLPGLRQLDGRRDGSPARSPRRRQPTGVFVPAFAGGAGARLRNGVERPGGFGRGSPAAR